VAIKRLMQEFGDNMRVSENRLLET
jgi:hypothetical protein